MDGDGDRKPLPVDFDARISLPAEDRRRWTRLAQLDWRAIAHCLRPHQWAKNALVFVPMVLGGKAGDPQAWLSAAIAFVALSLVASGTYCINDLVDLPNDRRHWSKRYRPLARGTLTIHTVLMLAAACLMLGACLGTSLGAPVLAIISSYVALTICYSLALKCIPLLDTLVLAALYTLRLDLGVVATGVRLSPWLMVLSMFVFMSLSTAKRHVEVVRSSERGACDAYGHAYCAADRPLLLAVGIATALGAVLIMVLYLIEDAMPRRFYASPALLWCVPPILFLFLGRIWLLSNRGEIDDDPVAFAVRDRTSLAFGLLLCAVFGAAILI